MGPFYAGLDVGDQTTSVCIIDAKGEVVHESSVATTPAAIAAVLAPFKRMLEKAGLETGSNSIWLYKELGRRRYKMVCMDARSAHGALSTGRNKSDGSDARGLARILRNGWYTNAHVKSDEALACSILLAQRRLIRRKAISLDLALRGTAKMFGAVTEKKGGELHLNTGARRSEPLLATVAEATIRARAALLREAKRLDDLVAKLAKRDPVCRRLMTVPGIGPVTALAYRAAVDDPSRFQSARDVAAYFGLTPRRFQSGQRDVLGHISKMGNKSVRYSLYEAAIVLICVSKSDCRLRRWALHLRKTKSLKQTAVAVARKLAVIMHRMWVTQSDFEASPSLA